MAGYDVPPKKELYYHYLECNMTIAWVAEYYHVSERVVKRWLNLYDLKKQGRSDLVGRAMYTLLTHGFSGRDVAILFDTTHTAVFKAKSVYEEKLKGEAE